MKNRVISMRYFLRTTALFVFCAASVQATFDEHSVLAQRLAIPSSKKPLSKRLAGKTVRFDYDNEDLIDIINEIAALKDVNIVLPMGANAITSKVTLNLEEPLSIDEAWNALETILDIAGYSLIPRGSMYAIVKNSKVITKEALPLYIGTEPSKIPQTDERIRFMYYLSNIKLGEDPKSGDVATILQEFLPAETANYLIEPKSNAIIITEKASIIHSVMRVIAALDQTTFQERLEIIKLRFTAADTVARLLSDNILKSADPRTGGFRARAKGETSYFSENVKIIPEPRSNTLIVLGRGQAVDRIKDFIRQYVDIELDSGNSILHVYQLQYLNAADFEGILNSIVQSERGGGSGQSTAGGRTGPERYFDGVIIKADQAKGDNKFGSNKLIIAAKSDDWKYIQRIIEKLDRPQPQVIIEVLIADLTLDDQRKLGTMFRNPAELPLPGGVNFQSAQIASVVLDSPPPSTPPLTETVEADLLARTIKTNAGLVSAAELTGATDPGLAGSTLFSISDKITGKTWGIAQLLKIFSNTKILSHPHVIATNNKQALVTIGERRLLAGEATATAAAPTIKTENVNANLVVTLTPRISADNTINLDVVIDISEFVIGSNTRTTRKIETHANVNSTQILALGGLTKTTTEDNINETPILGKIPILGWLFKSRANDVQKTTLTVFISATVVEPRLRGGISTYTKEYVELSGKYAMESQLFEGLRDPVTRFFFRTQNAGTESVQAFIDKDELKHDVKVAPTVQDAIAEKKRAKNAYRSENLVSDAHTPEQVIRPVESGSSPIPLQPVEQKTLAQHIPASAITHKKKPIVIAHAETPDEKLKRLLAHEDNPLLNAHHLVH
jgi:general secretion pathway protein D